MSSKNPTYQELKTKLAEAEEITSALNNEEVDAVIGKNNVALLRLKEVDEALREGEARFRSIIENTEAGYFFIDNHGLIQDVNKSWVRMYGYSSKDEIIGQHFAIIQKVDDIEKAKEFVNGIMKGDARYMTGEFSRKCKDGTIGYHTFSARPLSRFGKVVGIEGFIIDSTERRKMEEALRASVLSWDTTFNAITDSVSLIDVEGKILQCNKATANFLGKPINEIVGSTCWELVHGTLEPIKGCPIVRMRKTLRPESLELAVGDRVLYVATVPILDQDGNVAKAVHTITDITERKQTEKALGESEERFRTLADFTYDWEYWVAPDGQFIYVSPSCERITGYSPEEFMSDPGLIEKIVHPDDQSMVVSHIRGKQNREELFPIDFRIISRSGEERWLNHNCQPVHGIDGMHLGWRGSNRDITKRKQMEEELLKIKKLESLSVLAGGIAHQFNNALTAITGHTGLLEMEYPEDKKIMDYAKAMKQSAHRMVHLTSQLLAYARGGKYNPQTLSLSDFVEGILPIIHHNLDPDIRVERDLPPDVLNVEVDRTQIQMVLSAIVANSNEAIEPPGRIRISTNNIDLNKEFIKDHPGLKPGPYVCLSIEDDGKGMDEETRRRIFEPFFTTHFIGRGLGMASVYGIITNHDGVVSVDSELGKGTTVTIYLPALEAIEEVEEEVEERIVPEPAIELPTGEGTVLVIEDEEPLVELFRQILERLGYRVLQARTGEQAVEIAKTFDGRIDLALLDIKLPDMSGNQVYPLIMEAKPDLKVVVCSGYSIEGPAQAILDAGAEGFIQKSFSIAALAEKLKEVSEGK
jgi:two-component system cell cycle sensor histidine kinase/response regulator CckA